MGLDTIVTSLFGLFKRKPDPDLKELQDYYRQRIAYLKEDFEEQRGKIEQHRDKHKGNGIELDQWIRREDELHQRLIHLTNENSDLKEENMFLRKMKNWNGELGK